MFVSHNDPFYEGMVIGIHSRDQRLGRHTRQGQALTKRAFVGYRDEAVRLVPANPDVAEYAVEFIEDDELVEITPKSIRLRKRFLKSHERKKSGRVILIVVEHACGHAALKPVAPPFLHR